MGLLKKLIEYIIQNFLMISSRFDKTENGILCKIENEDGMFRLYRN